MQKLTTAICLIFLVSSSLAAQNRKRDRTYPPTIPEAKTEVYKTIGDVKLNMYIFAPKDHKPSDKRSTIMFFFGGGWKSGTPTQFREQCKYLASRGMVAMTADYRVRSRHETLADCCVADAKSAIRWVRLHAERLGVDPDRVVAAGGSAGRHIAACTGTIKGFEESTEDTSVSSVPNAMALFNPALVLGSVDGKSPLAEGKLETLRERMGVEPKKLSPYHHITEETPPTIIFHGKADSTVLYWTAEYFADAMEKSGNHCKLVGFENQPHGFFNFGRDGNKSFDATLKELDQFLVESGYLESKKTNARN